MKPLLHQNRDLVTIETTDERLKPLDVALYKRGDSYVLHRVIEVKDGYYLIRGDNTYMLEKVPDEDILGVLTGFMRKGKQHSVEEESFKRYSRVWNDIYPVRHAYMKCVSPFKRVYHGIRSRAARVEPLRRAYKKLRRRSEH